MERLAGAVERLEARDRPLEQFRRPDRSYDALGRQEPRQPFAGKGAVALLLRMGMAAEFVTVVPDRFVVRVLAVGEAIACTCGALAPVEVGVVTECPGAECDRFFLRTESSVRVARWAQEEAEAA